jgi:hypothetical protein
MAPNLCGRDGASKHTTLMAQSSSQHALNSADIAAVAASLRFWFKDGQVRQMDASQVVQQSASPRPIQHLMSPLLGCIPGVWFVLGRWASGSGQDGERCSLRDAPCCFVVTPRANDSTPAI